MGHRLITAEERLPLSVRGGRVPFKVAEACARAEPFRCDKIDRGACCCRDLFVEVGNLPSALAAFRIKQLQRWGSWRL